MAGKINTEADLANAQEELAQAKAYRSTGSDLVDANEGAASLNNLRADGLTVAEMPVERGYEDPSLIRIIYHAYDGRVVPVPSYMAAKKLAERFPNETFVPQSFRGRRAWFLEPQSTTRERMNLLCFLHSSQEQEIKDEVKAAGVPSGGCEKANIPSAFALEQHMKLKHKQEWGAIERLRARKEADTSRDQQAAQTAAIIELAKAMQNKEG